MKSKIEERGGRRFAPSKMLVAARNGITDEAFFLLGSDSALTRMMQREKSKMFTKVNVRNPLAMELPNRLITHKGHSMLLYDSRVSRPGQSDAVFVFSHPNLLDILRSNPKFSVDGTFRAAPAPWEQLWVIGCFVKRRIVIAINCLLPGKKMCYYEEALLAVKRAIAPVVPSSVMSDFEKAELEALRKVFPTSRLNGCQFHRGQFLMRKWKDLGLFSQANEENERAELLRRAFRDVLSLAYIPPNEVRRAFSFVVDRAPIGCQPFLGYFARVFIGLTAPEVEMGVDEAFAPALNDSRRNSTTSPSQHLAPMNNGSILFGRPSPAPATPTASTFYSDHNYGQHRWEMPIVRSPQYDIDFWNVHHRALASIEKTNNAMEASHQQFAKGLNHHPALSDLLFALMDDIDKQCAIARSAQAFQHVRRKRYVIKEECLMNTLNNAEYDTEDDLRAVLTLIGLQMQGFVAGIRVRNVENDRDQETETSESTSRILSDISHTFSNI